MRAASNGSLWVLEREAFRGVLLMKYMQRPSVKILRSVEIFSKLSLSHLHSLAEALTEATFEEGQVIVKKVSTPRFWSFLVLAVISGVNSLEFFLLFFIFFVYECYLIVFL